jgi:hypothetical protein
MDWLAKEASASSVMALVALPRETGSLGGKVDSGGPGRLSTARLLSLTVRPREGGDPARTQTVKVLDSSMRGNERKMFEVGRVE